jgi:hypothetical protein
MIAIARPLPTTPSATTDHAGLQPCGQEQFLALLPAIRRHAQVAFRHMDPEAREDAVAEVVASALVAFTRLAELGRAELAYAGPLARYAVARVRDGRCVGNCVNVDDVSSRWCQRRHGVQIESLDQRADYDGEWREMVVEDRRAGPAEIAAARLDMAAWLRVLPQGHRRIAEVLASGETTNATAKLFHISPGRVSQMRRKLYEAWCRFQGENVA